MFGAYPNHIQIKCLQKQFVNDFKQKKKERKRKKSTDRD
jgi:hypothetical protein